MRRMLLNGRLLKVSHSQKKKKKKVLLRGPNTAQSIFILSGALRHPFPCLVLILRCSKGDSQAGGKAVAHCERKNMNTLCLFALAALSPQWLPDLLGYHMYQRDKFLLKMYRFSYFFIKNVFHRALESERCIYLASSGYIYMTNSIFLQKLQKYIIAMDVDIIARTLN